MSRSLPVGMHYKECRILVEAAQMYYPKKNVGDAIVAIWNMPPELANTLNGMTCYLQATDAILEYQNQNWMPD